VNCKQAFYAHKDYVVCKGGKHTVSYLSTLFGRSHSPIGCIYVCHISIPREIECMRGRVCCITSVRYDGSLKWKRLTFPTSLAYDADTVLARHGSLPCLFSYLIFALFLTRSY